MSLQQLSGFCARVGRRIQHELNYYSRKAVFQACSAGIIDRDKFFEKRVNKHFQNESLKVFLNRSLSEIDLEIETDVVLKERIVSEGMLVMQHTLLVLNEHRPDMYDLQSGHYRWTEDFFTGYQYPNCFYMDVRKKETLPKTDIKIPWETARMQFLFALALSYRATKDETFAKRVIEIIRDFSICCPYDTGVNWNVSMEVGIRIANILLACELIQDAPCFGIEFKRFLAVTVYQHMLHIFNNLENPGDGNNHFIANILGLAATSAAMPFLPKANRCASYVQKMLHTEVMRQIRSDGGHFENSISYHRLVGEMISYAVIAQGKRGFRLSKEENDRLAAMGQFTDSLRMGNGLVPQLGDNDSGRVFQLSPENTRDHDSFINLVSGITNHTIVYPDRRDGFFVFADDNYPITSYPEEKMNVQLFPQTKLLRVRQNGVFFVFSGMTSERNGHSHNDVLSFLLSRDCIEFITDPGSGEYTGDREIASASRSVHSHSTISMDGKEQRTTPDDYRPFVWNTEVRSTLRQERVDDKAICFTGTCTYPDSNGKIMEQQRIVTVRSSGIVIEDHLYGMERMCSMTLPVFPSIRVTETEEGIILMGGEYHLKISGTYHFSLIPCRFAVQYRKIVLSKAVLCNSNSEYNELRMEWVD